VQVTIGIEQNMAAQLIQQGQTVPSPVPGFALLDTGASTTCIDDDVAQQLGLPVTNQMPMVSASHTSMRNVYPCSIDIVGLPVPISALSAMGAALAPQGIIALIGRDLLRHCTLFYNGVTGEFTLSI